MPRKYLRPLAVGKTIVQFWILAAKIKPKKIKIKRKTVRLQVGLATASQCKRIRTEKPSGFCNFGQKK
jgi:hypothetical protein